MAWEEPGHAATADAAFRDDRVAWESRGTRGYPSLTAVPVADTMSMPLPEPSTS